MKPVLAILSLAAVAAPAIAAPPVIPIPSGTYHCIAGNTRMMLTLGDVAITGNRYVFTDPLHHSTSGGYAMTPTGYRWSGDYGAVTNAQIVDSGPDEHRGNYWLKYRARPGSLPQTLACMRV